MRSHAERAGVVGVGWHVTMVVLCSVVWGDTGRAVEQVVPEAHCALGCLGKSGSSCNAGSLGACSMVEGTLDELWTRSCLRRAGHSGASEKGEH